MEVASPGFYVLVVGTPSPFVAHSGVSLMIRARRWAFAYQIRDL